MNRIKFLLWTAVVSLTIIIACSDLQEDLPEQVSGSIKIHQDGWNADPSSASFHGKYLKNKAWELTECEPCHGSSYTGGVSGKSCFTCHSTYPHAEGWEADTSGTGFHGKYLKTKDWNPAECKSCHGDSYEGGTSYITCFACHPSFPHEVKFSGDEGHQEYLENHGYPIAECRVCHGASLTGGARVKLSCSASGCHEDAVGNPKSPETCNTCHGGFRRAADDTASWAPPQSLTGDTLSSSPGVGAHQAHLTGTRLSLNARCEQCHTVYQTVFEEDHLDSEPPAELIFNPSLAALITADSTFQPSPSYDALRCGGVYCHGNWKLRRASSPNNWAFTDSVMSGEAFNPSWTAGAIDAQCGSCHGLPPLGHINQSSCSNCHTGVVDPSRNIIDKTKHINGRVNVLGTERPL